MILRLASDTNNATGAGPIDDAAKNKAIEIVLEQSIPRGPGSCYSRDWSDGQVQDPSSRCQGLTRMQAQALCGFRPATPRPRRYVQVPIEPHYWLYIFSFIT